MEAFYQLEKFPEAGCDEAGRGCLAGPVVAAAVIFPRDYFNSNINDSKQLSERKRVQLRDEIMREALSFGIGMCDNHEIDRMNILQASLEAMHRALDRLAHRPEFIIIDGNKWRDYNNTPFQTVVKGDSKYLSIAAASILAKCARDEIITSMASCYPAYHWEKNKGYPTKDHRLAILEHGVCPLHRLTYGPCQPQLGI